MEYRLLVPAGIGDFSWLWSKLSTTEDTYHIEYTNNPPHRLGAFLNLLPKDRILSHKLNENYKVGFSVKNLTMTVKPMSTSTPTVRTAERYCDLRPHQLMYIEPNTHVEHGKRIEEWLGKEIPNTNLHYKIEGLLDNPKRQNFFIVHLSSYHMQQVWSMYKLEDWISIISMIQKQTGWTPIFVGGSYDDFASDVYEKYSDNNKAISLIGKTEDLISVLCLTQQCKLFLGCISSGLTMLSNVLYTPSISWWPRTLLPTSWADESVGYKHFQWKEPKKDEQEISEWIKRLL